MQVLNLLQEHVDKVKHRALSIQREEGLWKVVYSTRDVFNQEKGFATNDVDLETALQRVAQEVLCTSLD